MYSDITRIEGYGNGLRAGIYIGNFKDTAKWITANRYLAPPVQLHPIFTLEGHGFVLM